MSTLDTIREIVVRYVPGADVAAQGIENFATLRGALESLQRTEEAVFYARGELERVKELGFATDNDFAAFDVIRSNLFAAQFGWYTLLRNTVGGVYGSRTAAQLPAPTILPGVAPPTRVFRARTPLRFASLSATASRRVATAPEREPGDAGSAAASAGAASGLGAIQFSWAAAVIAVLAALALMVLYAYFVGAAIEEISRVLIVERQTEQYRELIRGRTQAYQTCLNGSERQYADCMAAGGVADVCRNTIITQCLDAAGVLVPTPEDAGLRPPESSSSNPYKWVVVGIGGTLVVITAAVIYSWRRSSGVKGVAGAPALRGPQRVFDLDGPSEYNLEVGKD